MYPLCKIPGLIRLNN